MSDASESSSGVTTARLSVMMFLQFFAWGSWFATMALAMDKHGFSGASIGGAYETAPIAAIFAPLFLGVFADRFFSSEKVFGVLMLLGGAIMCLLPGIAAQGQESSSLLVWGILAYMLCYMPTLGLGNTIAFTHISDQNKFPFIRVWGTIGWILAGLLIGITGWDGQFIIFWLGGISSLVLGLYCFTLPNTPPPLKGQPLNLRSIFMVDAFKLLTNWNFLVFAVCSTLVCIPLAFYYGSSSTFLGHTGFMATGATLTLGQMSEIFFMLLIPFFFRRLGVKGMILIGIACWVIRYLLFSFGAPQQATWMLLLAVLLHGVCYDFFFVTGFMYTDQKAPKEIRGQAQALLVFLTQGIGMFFGFRIMSGRSLFGIPLNLTFGDYGSQVTTGTDYNNALTAARGELPSVSFVDKFGQMFSRDLPADLPADQLEATMQQWQNFWMSPAIMAAIIFVVFAVLFWEKSKPSETADADA